MAKICERCRVDVSDKKRMKDAKGRYFCAECVKALRAKQPKPAPARAAAPAAAAGGGNVMSDLIDDAFADMGEPCPQCQSPMQKGAALCTRCGFNVESGRSIKTRVQLAPKDKPEPGSGGSGGAAVWVPVGLAVVLGGVFCTGFIDPMLFLAYGLLFLIATFAVWIILIASAFMDGNAKWGVGILFLSWVPILGWYLQIKYVTDIAQREMLKNTVMVMIGASVLSGLFFKLAPESMWLGDLAEDDAWVEDDPLP